MTLGPWVKEYLNLISVKQIHFTVKQIALWVSGVIIINKLLIITINNDI